jgi:hypothetical protein
MRFATLLPAQPERCGVVIFLVALPDGRVRLTEPSVQPVPFAVRVAEPICLLAHWTFEALLVLKRVANRGLSVDNLGERNAHVNRIARKACGQAGPFRPGDFCCRVSAVAARLLDAGSIFSIAIGAAKGIDAPRREGGKMAALVSVVFAQTSLEAFLNESIELADDCISDPTEPQIVSAFAQLMSDFERSHISLQSRFQLAHWMLTGKPYGKDAPPYRDFSLLLRVRNALVHFKADAALEFPETGQAPAAPNSYSVLVSLRSKGILAELEPGIQAPWIFSIGTKAAAEWACDSAAQMVFDFLANLPQSKWRGILELCYRSSFSAQF